MDGYNSLLYNKGEQVELETIEGELLFAGEVIGVSSSGELLLRTEPRQRHSGQLRRSPHPHSFT